MPLNDYDRGRLYSLLGSMCPPDALRDAVPGATADDRAEAARHHIRLIGEELVSARPGAPWDCLAGVKQRCERRLYMIRYLPTTAWPTRDEARSHRQRWSVLAQALVAPTADLADLATLAEGRKLASTPAANLHDLLPLVREQVRVDHVAARVAPLARRLGEIESRAAFSGGDEQAEVRALAEEMVVGTRKATAEAKDRFSAWERRIDRGDLQALVELIATVEAQPGPALITGRLLRCRLGLVLASADPPLHSIEDEWPIGYS